MAENKIYTQSVAKPDLCSEQGVARLREPANCALACKVLYATIKQVYRLVECTYIPCSMPSGSPCMLAI